MKTLIINVWAIALLIGSFQFGSAAAAPVSATKNIANVQMTPSPRFVQVGYRGYYGYRPYYRGYYHRPYRYGYRGYYRPYRYGYRGYYRRPYGYGYRGYYRRPYRYGGYRGRYYRPYRYRRW